MAENLDLLGWPIPEPRDAGRPEHVPTDENRSKIMMLLVFGKSNAEIAKAIGLSQPTMRKHYLQQLEQRKIARLQLDATRFAALYGKVIAGDVSAMRELGKVLQEHDRKELAAAFDKPQRQAKVEKLGKKEQAVVDAEQAAIDAGDWGDDLMTSKPN